MICQALNPAPNLWNLPVWQLRAWHEYQLPDSSNGMLTHSYGVFRRSYGVLTPSYG